MRHMNFMFGSFGERNSNRKKNIFMPILIHALDYDSHIALSKNKETSSRRASIK